MHVLVVGAGAVGSFLAATLGQGGEDVTLASRGAAPADAQTIEVREASDAAAGTVATVATVRRVEIDADPPVREPAGHPDVVVLAVRQPEVAAALRSIARWPDAAVVTVQNGIGAEEAAAAARPRAPLVAASLTTSLELTGPGRVVRLNRGGIGLAAVTEDAEPIARRLSEAFASGGLRAAVLDDAAAMKWSKLLANLVANATSALLDIDPGRVYADPRLFALERRQLRETAAVMRRLGLRPIALPGADVRLLALATRLPGPLGRPVLRRVVAGARGGKSPSLRLYLASIDHAAEPRPGASEARWLNGAVASTAARLGARAPVNEALARLADEAAADDDLRTGLRGNPDRLLAEVGMSREPVATADG